MKKKGEGGEEEGKETMKTRNGGGGGCGCGCGCGGVWKGRRWRKRRRGWR